VRGYAQKVGDEIIGIAETKRQRDKEIEERLEVYPTVSRNEFRISYIVGRNAMDIQLRIYDIKGSLIKHWDKQMVRRGEQITWDGSDGSNCELPTGIYFCILEVGGQTLIKKIILLR